MTNQGRESRDRLMAAGVVPILERFAHCALRSHLRSPTPHSASTTSRRVLSDLGYRNEDFDTEGSGVLKPLCYHVLHEG